MGYVVTLFDGTSHTIQGEGTQAEPYLIDCAEGILGRELSGYYEFIEIISKEQELPVAGDTAEDIARKKKTIDMNRVAPKNLFSLPGLTVNNPALFIRNGCIINGNDTIIKNLYVEYTADNLAFLNFSMDNADSEINNLHFLNGYINILGNYNFNIFYFYTYGQTGSINNCKFSLMVNCSKQVSIINHNNTGVFDIYACSFNIRFINEAAYTIISNGTTTGSIVIKNCVFRLFSVKGIDSFRPLYTGGGSYDPVINMTNCKIIYEMLNYVNSASWNIVGSGGFRANKLTLINCTFKPIWKKNDIGSAGMGTFIVELNIIPTCCLLISEHTFSLSGNYSNYFNRITNAQSLDSDYLISLGFPVMWEDE